MTHRNHEQKQVQRLAQATYKYAFGAIVTSAVFGGLYYIALDSHQSTSGGIYGWSEMADAFNTVFGLPVAIAGTYVAILLAVKALQTTERQTELAERQNALVEEQIKLAEAQQKIENRTKKLEVSERIRDIAEKTFKVYSSIADALDRLGRAVRALDRRLVELAVYEKSQSAVEEMNEEGSQSSKHIAVRDARDKAAEALDALSEAVSAAHKDPVARAAWLQKSLRFLSPDDANETVRVLSYYAQVERVLIDVQSASLNPATDHIETPSQDDTRYQEDRDRLTLPESETHDPIKSCFVESRAGSDNTYEKLFGIGLAAAEIARDLLGHADELRHTSIEELQARRRLSEYNLALDPFVSFTLKQPEKAGQPKRFDFLDRENTSQSDEALPLKSPQGRSTLFNGCLGDTLFSFWPALSTLSTPQVIGSFFNEPVPVPESFKKTKRLSVAKGDEKQKIREEQENQKLEDYRKALDAFKAATEGVSSDFVTLNRLGLQIVAILEKLPIDMKQRPRVKISSKKRPIIKYSREKNETTVSLKRQAMMTLEKYSEWVQILEKSNLKLDSTELELLTKSLEEADICGLMPVELHIAMGEFERNGALLLALLPPMDTSSGGSLPVRVPAQRIIEKTVEAQGAIM